jgi:hypothetical protein
MRIQKVIHSSNNNPLYLDFWPVVSKIWSVYFNVEPILLYINDSTIDAKVKIDNSYGSVIEFKPVDNIPISLQTLWIRYWYPINEPDTTFMISDIDMIPLSKFYFIENITEFTDNQYVHINPCLESYGLIPSCYHIAKGHMFQNILELSNNFSEDLNKLESFDKSNPTTGWFNDEKYATHQILSKIQNGNSNIQLKPRLHGQNGRRIDRSNWSYDPRLVPQDYYFDSHSIRPYSKYSSEINSLCNLLKW